MSRIGLLLCLAGCATTTEGPKRFPSADELRRLTETPPAERTGNLKETDLDGWALSGPLPARIETVPHGGADPWDGLLSEVIGQGFASESMHCVAREAGRFFLANAALPSPRLRAFMANRCGSPAAEVSVSYSSGAVPAAVSDAQVFEHWRGNAAVWLGKQLSRGQLTAGLWFGRQGDKGVVMLALQARRALVDPLDFRPGSDGSVVLSGELLVPTALLQANITRGPYGYATCTPDAAVKLPRFAVRCNVEPADASARIEMGAFAQGRITGPIVVDLAVWPSRAPDSVWRHSLPSESAQPPATGEPDEALLAMVNQIRAQASLPPLLLAGAESRTAAKIARHYFAAILGLEPELVADQVVLGVRAGWEVEGAVRMGHFAAGAVTSSDPRELLTALLERPSGRETLLAPAAARLAVGTFREGDQVLAGVLGSYEFVDERETNVEQVVARLTELRRAAGRPAPRVVKDLQSEASQIARQMARGRSPRSAMHSLIETVAEWNRGSAHGWAVDYLGLDSLTFPPELINAPSLQLAVAVSTYKPLLEPWTRCVAVIVSADQTLASRPGRVASLR